jgi:hypothetical protein
MSHGLKIGLLVVVLVIAGAWYSLRHVTMPSQQEVMGQQSSKLNDAQTITANRDDSDTSLDQDLTTVDTQFSAYQSDSASVDQGLNDQPIAQ